MPDFCRRLAQGWVNLFVLWVILASLAAYWWPAPFAALSPGIVPGLGIIMFGMGMTLNVRDFTRVLKQPLAVLCGIAAQFLVMPLLALGLARLFHLNDQLAIGFVILGCCPGGTASNVICFLAKADVALSVTLTACSTVLATFLTPLLVFSLGGTYLPVDPWALLWSICTIVLFPVTAGLLVHWKFPHRFNRVTEFFPAVSVAIIVLVIAAIMAKAHGQLRASLGPVALLVILHNSLGLLLGYAMASLLGLPEKTRRTISIEVGMQNSGLGVALASAHFSPLAALPASLFSVAHNLSGSLLASYWRRN